eukprot:NODE_6175_length_653_cov_60.418251_g6152_i0.p1 GENE.NODE_6175_length_653_cov_60.418251_g6152_i0~~NODE_6175_length_653_cov_60.418251_g6152_i0.p1  ORF type:complete len:160 (-),score=34.53 NODE_6175_length_653_cov_60.418251_g6152_i0:77-556(-)
MKYPTELLQRTYLQPAYDDPEFIVHNLWRLYAGWWDQNPSHLKPPSDSALASEVAGAAGGSAVLAKRALRLHTQDTPQALRLASSLVEFAVQAEPDNVDAHRARVQVYTALEGKETSLMAQSIFRSARQASQAAITRLTGEEQPPEPHRRPALLRLARL